ncbi:MAG: carboxypeptidase regulatory-like domain-containing protein [candidate division Zixibacteria bacterium]|nr:carboxypeptidase regulatory-like domain-containing protein [candidate division Zixibacteria bacterium]
MSARFVRGFRFVAVLGVVVVFSACKGSTGPPGLVNKGRVSGKVTVWEDAVFNSSNSPTSIPAGGFTVTTIGDSTRSTTTGPDGSYVIEDVPGGTYVLEFSKNADSPSGYGTMKRYNLFAGGGDSFHSGSIGRKGPKPNAVSAALDSVSTLSGAKLPGIRVAWTITPAVLQFSTFFYVMTFQSPTVGATTTVIGTGALADTSIVVGLPPGSYSVSVQSDVGFGYVDESDGDTIFPSRSAATIAPSNVVLTRPTIVDLSTKKLEKEFPGRRVVVAKILE